MHITPLSVGEALQYIFQGGLRVTTSAGIRPVRLLFKLGGRSQYIHRSASRALLNAQLILVISLKSRTWLRSKTKTGV
jgi:hypothetical protein